MLKMMKKFLFLSLAAIVTAMMLTHPSTALAQKPVRLVYVEWDDAFATTTLAKAAIEDHLKLPVDILSVSAAAMWVGVATGDADAMLTASLPVTHGDYLARTKGKVVDLGPLAKGSQLGWIVPDYVTITSIADLDANAAKFNRRIIGVDPGSGLMRLSEQVLKDYGIKNLTLMEGSGATMVAALAEAIRKKEWIVVAGWTPHWKFGRWNLRFLDDPKETLGKHGDIHTVVRLGLEKDRPEVYEFLKRFHYQDIGQLGTLMDWNSQPNANAAENARRFMRENPDLVKTWFDKNFVK